MEIVINKKGPKSLPHSVGKGAHGGSTLAEIGQFVVSAALTGPWSWGKRADVGAADFQKDRRFTGVLLLLRLQTRLTIDLLLTAHGQGLEERVVFHCMS
jgi:hypothetical protein